jgi:hypothetical protein
MSSTFAARRSRPVRTSGPSASARRPQARGPAASGTQRSHHGCQRWSLVASDRSCMNSRGLTTTCSAVECPAPFRRRGKYRRPAPRCASLGTLSQLLAMCNISERTCDLSCSRAATPRTWRTRVQESPCHIVTPEGFRTAGCSSPDESFVL